MLEAHNLTAAFDGRIIFQNLSLAVEPGERVQVAAPSGAGKTTLARILAGYARPRAGEVRIDGAPLPRRGACPVQLIGQHPERATDPRQRMSAMLAEASADEEELARLGAAFGIQDRWLSRFPHELSGGELQRFCIVRALAANPRYLIADEISTMLDALTQAQIWQALLVEAETRDLGLVFTTHSAALAERIATRIVELRPQ
ncbi:ATP-binding cassette domain-containing protein [Adlercreutzia sp. R21]|uniref:ATP-binding cassette domain-containing protein n=1 Tax=Adlercreutzia wanghongyangiae TaxID=3111451 RepID=A0ABU6IJQ1_9ACTN|nr:ATP-binding cassette domain-containing protein [Adlercreutzia sp. R21]MEC4176697.1 ATP-binding cassette domain-containing protein [Adlercreutzia sp. R7]MEC4183687.1 ATP-binding cassette domain-containing protein [Adlercreutzia sp. R21]